MLTYHVDGGNYAERALRICHMSNRGQQSANLSDASDSSRADRGK